MKSIWDGIEHWNTICHCCRYLPNICFRYYMSLWAIPEQFSRTGTTSSHSCNYDWDIYKMFFGVWEIWTHTNMYISVRTLVYFGFYCNPVVLAIEWLQNKYHITRTFGYESMFATSGIYTLEVAGKFCGPTSNKMRSSLAEASWNNQWEPSCSAAASARFKTCTWSSLNHKRDRCARRHQPKETSKMLMQGLIMSAGEPRPHTN